MQDLRQSRRQRDMPLVPRQEARNRPHRRAIPVRQHQPHPQRRHTAEVSGCARHRPRACTICSPHTTGVRRTTYEVIVPVVSHPSRVRKRGYSQAALIASKLGPLLNTPVEEDMLRRVRDAPSQLQTASRNDRWTNVLDGFVCESDLTGMNVLLVDDLVTTGSTASACASALKVAGAEKVVALPSPGHRSHLQLHCHAERNEVEPKHIMTYRRSSRLTTL